MAHRKGIIPKWSQQFAYCVGLLVSDGNLSPNGRHLVFTSTDLELIETFKKGLSLSAKIGTKTSGFGSSKKQYRIQFGNTSLYEHFVSLGITPRKSLTIGEITLPTEYFWDFLRGCIDGDGSIRIYRHPESKCPQVKVSLASGSKSFLLWIQTIIKKVSAVSGGWICEEKACSVLSFGKTDSLIILKEMYKNPGKWYLNRKKELADQILS